MWAFSEFFDHFSVESWNVGGFATRNQSVIDDDLLINPARPRVAHVYLNCWPGSHFPSANKIRVDQDLGAMTDDRHRFALMKEMPRKI